MAIKTINKNLDENLATARAIIQNWKKYKVGHNQELHARFFLVG